tara:strand:- start:65 stop:3034 length:2970 start_codon:yes stop_codon:yes gene_type:complete
MDKKSEINDLCKKLNINIQELSIDLDKLEKLIKFEEFDMGKPIILAKEIPDNIFILLEGQVRQLVDNPLNGEIMTLELFNPYHILGIKSLKANEALEFATAASKCKFAKVSFELWQKLNKKNSTKEFVDTFEIFPILIKEKVIKFPENPKEFRTFIKEISQQCKVKNISLIDKRKKLNLDKTKEWYFAANADFIDYGSPFDYEQLENSKGTIRIIGIPKLKDLNKKDELIVENNKPKELIKQTKVIKKEVAVTKNKKGSESIKKEIFLEKKYPFYGSTDEIIPEAVSCFRIIADILQIPIKVDLIKRAFSENVSKKEKRIRLRLCASISESLGLKTQLLDLPVAMVSRIQTPCLIQFGKDELAVICEIKNDHLVVARPRHGLKKFKISEFVKIFANEKILPVLILRTTNKTPKKRFGLKWFLPSIKKNRKPLVEVLIASLFVNVFQLMNPLIIQQIIDKVIGQGGVQSLLPLATLLLSFSIFENLLTAIRTNLFIDTTNRIDISLGEQVIDHLLRLPLTYFDKRPVGELSSRIGELEQIRSFLTGTALTLVLDSTFSIIYIAVMLLYSWVLTIVALLVAPFLAIITITISPIIRRQLRKKAELNASTQNHLVEILTGVQTVKAQNFEINARWKWKERYTKYISESYRNAVTSTTANSLTQFLNQVSGLVVLCVGSYLVIRGDLTLGGLIAFRIISGYVTGPLLRLSNLYQNFQQTNISLERLSDIIDNQTESDEKDNDNIPMPLIEGAINFEEVSFRFSEKGKLNLSNINFEIKKGEFVAIVGQSGSGKSTLTKLMARLYEPLSGKISIDKIDISKVELYSLRRQIGIVPQDSILFEGTVQENIALTNPESNTDEIINAAKIASAHNFIMNLPSGYASNVGERGGNLSGGQRQRIAIARSILQNPQLLIMDESTSALDFDTERKVSLNLMDYFRGKTVLFITHRLNSIINADKIVMIHEGRIDEIGNHNELMDLKGRYYSLFKQQEREG